MNIPCGRRGLFDDDEHSKFLGLIDTKENGEPREFGRELAFELDLELGLE